jgi:flagellar assembly factor FliW
MLIQTSRFGRIEVDEARIISFSEGLPGFPKHRRFALVQPSPDPVFLWMQCVDDPELAFVVCDPRSFVPDYRVPIRKDEIAALAFADAADCHVLVIVNTVNGELTANLLGPIVVGAHSRRARQVVLSDKRYGIRHRLLSRCSRQPVAQMA